MRSIDDIIHWREQGLVMTPVQDGTKKPVTVNKKHYFKWTCEELQEAERISFFQKESGVFTLDFDDKTYEAHKYIPLFPKTFLDGKFLDETVASFVPTHLTYRINGQGALDFKYPKGVTGKDGGLLIETLSNKSTVFDGGDRKVVSHDLKEADINELRKYCSLTCFMVEVSRNFPPANDGARHDAHLRLTGALARLNEKEYPTDLLEKFHEKFCYNIGDTKELKDRMIIAEQRAALENGKKVFGITELRKFLGDLELAAYNLLIEHSDTDVPEEENKPEDDDPNYYPLISGLEFDTIEYPKVEYILNPVFTSRSFNQIYGYYESGKTVFGLACSIAMASGQEFLGWKSEKSVPTLYVESELTGHQFSSVRSSILQGYLDQGKTFNHANHFTLTHDDLAMAGFKYGFKDVAVARENGKRAAIDYGKKGRRFILEHLKRIEKKTGQKPFYFLDNMTRLASIDENKATDWNPFINWGVDLKNDGYSGLFVHHANKGNDTKGSSGSSTIGRLLDTSIALRKLDPDYRFDIKGDKSLQSSIFFDKSRGFGGSKWSKKRIITMDENGIWKHYPYLPQVAFQILKLHTQGLSQQQIRDMARNKEIGEPPLSAPSVDRYYLELVNLGLISRSTVCWNCRKEISTDADGNCPKCKSGIPCSNCGKCYCENPKKKKRI